MQLSRLLRVLLNLELIVHPIPIRVILILQYLIILSHDIVELPIKAIVSSILLLGLEELLLLRRRNVQILNRYQVVWHVHIIVLDVEVLVCQVDAP